MKTLKNILLIPGLFLFVINTSGQSECKVLKTGIDAKYEGECKKGLAHGKGKATGLDYYEGEFKKGLPQGKGIYRWATGEIYEGEWKKGLRDGTGKYIFQFEGRDSIMTGLWSKDKYKGIPEFMKYTIVRQINVDRYTVKQLGEGAKVDVKLLRNGTVNSTVSSPSIWFNSGVEKHGYNVYGYDNVTFPLKGRITYTTWNKLNTQQINCIFELEIKQPGWWELTIHN